MVGAVIVTHGSLGESLLSTARGIAGEFENVASVSIVSSSGVDEIKKSISDAVSCVDSGDGVIIFTDMLGGTPTNISLTLIKEGKVEIIAGVNLPVFIKFTSLRKTKSFKEIIKGIKDYGASTIVIAGDVLKEDK